MPRPAALALLLAGVAPLAAPAAALADRLEAASKVDAVSVHPTAPW